MSTKPSEVNGSTPWTFPCSPPTAGCGLLKFQDSLGIPPMASLPSQPSLPSLVFYLSLRPWHPSSPGLCLVFLARDMGPHRSPCPKFASSSPWRALDSELLFLTPAVTWWREENHKAEAGLSVAWTLRGALVPFHNEINGSCLFYLPCRAVVRMKVCLGLGFAIKPNADVSGTTYFYII